MAGGQGGRVRVLVTGAFGQLGRVAVERLLREGHEVVAFDVPKRRNRRVARRFRGGVTTVWGDIREAKDVRACVAVCDAIVHNAGILAPPSEKNPELARAVNVDGTRHLLDAMKSKAAPPVLVFSSSLSVCGLRTPGGPPLTADDPATPTDHYTTHKAECERMLQESGLPFVILRIGVSVGANLGAVELSPDVFRLLFSIDPDTRLEWVHPEDVALAQARAIETPAAFGKILMIGGGEGCQLTFRELYGTMFEASGVGRFPPEAYGRGPYYCDWLDTTESEALLRYQQHRFDDFVEEFRAAYRWTRPLARAFAPVVRRAMLHYSDAWQARGVRS